jgi:hypothetical protein
MDEAQSVTPISSFGDHCAIHLPGLVMMYRLQSWWDLREGMLHTTTQELACSTPIMETLLHNPFMTPPKRITIQTISSSTASSHDSHPTYHISYTMCNSRPTQLMQPESNTPQVKEEAGRRDPATLDPRKKASLAKLFMHNPQFAETFFRARIGMFSLCSIQCSTELGWNRTLADI